MERHHRGTRRALYERARRLPHRATSGERCETKVERELKTICVSAAKSGVGDTLADGESRLSLGLQRYLCLGEVPPKQTMLGIKVPHPLLPEAPDGKVMTPRVAKARNEKKKVISGNRFTERIMIDLRDNCVLRLLKNPHVGSIKSRMLIYLITG